MGRSNVYHFHCGSAHGSQSFLSKKSFWLTGEGHLMCTESYTEHCKLHNVWLKNAVLIESSESDDHSKAVLTTSAAAHKNLIRICTEAQAVSRGHFFYMYPRDPVLRDDASGSKSSISQRQLTPGLINCTQWKRLTTGADLIRELEPLYATYFAFVANPRRFTHLTRRVEELEAQSLMQTDYDEIQLGSKIRQDWFTRMLIRLTLLFFS